MRSAEPADRTRLDSELIGPLAPVEIRHAPGGSPLTPASQVALRALGAHHGLLSGVGIDWGSGTGCLAIVAARAGGVRRVIGLDISAADVRIAAENAVLNGVADRVAFYESDSYRPVEPGGRRALERVRGSVDFVVANPPHSEGDDGFGFRRAVLAGARDYVREGGRVFLNISYQYGAERVRRLVTEVGGFRHAGVLATTGWVPFDADRDDLRHCLELYAEEEARGGLGYRFRSAEREGVGAYVDARTAVAEHRRTGRSPYSKWECHLFVRTAAG